MTKYLGCQILAEKRCLKISVHVCECMVTDGLLKTGSDQLRSFTEDIMFKCLLYSMIAFPANTWLIFYRLTFLSHNYLLYYSTMHYLYTIIRSQTPRSLEYKFKRVHIHYIEIQVFGCPNPRCGLAKFTIKMKKILINTKTTTLYYKLFKFYCRLISLFSVFLAFLENW